METALSIAIGLCLSAAAGFRIFVPLLVMSIAAQTGHIELSDSFSWISSTPALIAFAAAMCFEVAAYYIPWFDNLLDTMAAPVAIVAGTLITASFITEMSPFLRWTLAIVAGGGIAGVVHTATGLTRIVSTTTTGGAGNAAIATAELGSAAVLSAAAVLVPAGTIVLLVALAFYTVRKLKNHRRLQTREIP